MTSRTILPDDDPLILITFHFAFPGEPDDTFCWIGMVVHDTDGLSMLVSVAYVPNSRGQVKRPMRGMVSTSADATDGCKARIYDNCNN